MAVGHWTQRRPREVQKESGKGSHQAGRSGLGSSARLPDPQGSSAARAAAFPAGPSRCTQMPLFMPSLPEEPPGASLCSSQPPAEHLPSDVPGTAQPHCPAFPVPGSTHSQYTHPQGPQVDTAVNPAHKRRKPRKEKAGQRPDRRARWWRHSWKEKRPHLTLSVPELNSAAHRLKLEQY